VWCKVVLARESERAKQSLELFQSERKIITKRDDPAAAVPFGCIQSIRNGEGVAVR
jgi:hypothetical protein